MRDEPNARGLLDIARETLLKELVPLLPAEHRYDALMVASAIAAAAREVEAGDGPLREELGGLAQLLGVAPEEGVLEEELLRLNVRLTAQIRAGAFDRRDPRRGELVRHLKATTARRLRETNPKYLAAERFA